MGAGLRNFYIAGQNQIQTGVGWKLREKKTLTGAVQDYDFTTVLNGDAENTYMVIYRVVGAAANCILIPRLNGANCAGNRQYMRVENAAITAARAADVRMGGAGGVGTIETGYMLFHITTGQARGIDWMTTTSLEAAGIMYEVGTTNITTPATSANITSVGLASFAAGGLGIGTELMLFSL